MEKYTREKVIGQGKFGSASLCTENSTGRKVVVKTISKGVGSKQLNSFKREVSAMRLLKHPNIVEFIDSFEDGENSYIVMEFADGGDLEETLKSGAVEELVGVRILYQLISALVAIHEKKIVHKDVKPENILLDSEGNVKLADFGIAKILEAEGDVGKTMAYSKDYGAPELFKEGSYDTKYDIFSAGVVSYQMFAGILPFDNQDQRNSGQFKPLPKTLDQCVRETIGRMLTADPKKRPAAAKILSVLKKEYGEIKKGMTWKVDKKKLIISGLGPIPDCDEGAPWTEQQDSIQALKVMRGVKEIGDFAFFGLTKLTAVELHSDLKSISRGAFMNCEQLKTITIPDSVTHIGASAFENCTSLKTVILPKDLSEIQCYTFYGCTNLKEINLGGVSSIGKEAFENTKISVESTSTTEEDPEFLLKLSKLYQNESFKLEYEDRIRNLLKIASESGGISVTKETELLTSELSQIYLKEPGGIKWVREGGLEWGFDKRIERLVVKGKGSFGDYSDGRKACQMKNYSFYDDLPWEEYKDQIRSIVICYGISSIGGYAFSGCRGLTTVTIPDSVTSIGESAFRDCSGLTSITIPNSVTSIGESAFFDCSGLTTITVPNSVTSIGIEAFYKCSGLTTITVPNSVTSIGRSAFEGCSGLTAITIPNSVTSIGNYAFCKCSGLTAITIPDSVTSIGDCAFQFCSVLTTITIPDSVTSIGDCAFQFCSVLTTITISNSVTSIGDGAFQYCDGLTTIIIPNSVTSIGKEAFYDCSGLKTITIPNSVTSIGDYAFWGCSGLTTITIPNSVTSIGEHAFDGCSGLTSITIPNSVTSIGEGAFSDCSGLTTITIPDSVTTIGDYAFYECSGLTTITIPNSVTSIGKKAFHGCSVLTSVSVPRGLEYPDDAFPDSAKITKY